MTSRRSSRGSIGSQRTRVGQLPLRPSKLSSVFLSGIGGTSWMVMILPTPFFLRFLLNVLTHRCRRERIYSWYLACSRYVSRWLATTGRYNILLCERKYARNREQ